MLDAQPTGVGCIMQVPTRSHVPAYNMQAVPAVPYVPYQPTFQPPVQMSFQPAFTQPCMVASQPIQPGMYGSHASSKKSMRAVSPTRPSRSSVSALRVTKTAPGKAFVPQMRLQAVHPLPYSPSLVPGLPLLQGPAFPLAPS